jgi:hypothetical protein
MTDDASFALHSGVALNDSQTIDKIAAGDDGLLTAGEAVPPVASQPLHAADNANPSWNL